MTALSRFYSLARFEFCCALRQSMEYLNPLFFFILIVCLFPLAIGPEASLLRNIAPGIIWVAALMASLLALQPLFRADVETGYLDKLLTTPGAASVSIYAKLLVHWCMSGLPLVLIAPLLGVLLGLPAHANITLMLSLLLGTPVLSFIGAIAVALSLGVKHNNFLLPLIVLPLFIPVLIFGASAVIASSQLLPSIGQLEILTALFILAVLFAPPVTTAALRIGEFQ